MEKLIGVLQEIKPDIDFESCTTLIDDELLDSFDIITIVSELSEAYDISIPASEIIPENFNSAQALYAMVQKLEEEDWLSSPSPIYKPRITPLYYSWTERQERLFERQRADFREAFLLWTKKEYWKR